MAEPGATTVAHVLQLVSGLRVVAGKQGLTRAVCSVNVMEVPDVAPWVRPGDFLMTVLYSLRHDAAAQEALVPLLHERGAAALAVKPGRYVEAIAPGMVEAADRLGLPLLEMAPHLSYSDLALPIAAAIVNRQAALVSWQQRAHRELIQAMLEGRGVEWLVGTVAALVENPVALVDERGHVLATAGAAGEAASLQAVATARPPVLAFAALNRGEAARWRETLEVEGRRVARVVCLVTAGDAVFGYLCLWERARPAREWELTVLDVAGVVAAVELRFRRSLWQVEWRYRGEFLRDLLVAPVASESQLVERAQQFGCDLGRPHAVVVLVAGAEARPGSPVASGELQPLVPGGLVGVLGGEVVALVPEGATRDGVRAVARQLRTRAGEGRQPVAAGVGSRACGVSELRRSYQEARRAAQLGWRVWQQPDVYVYEDLGVYQLLAWVDPAAPPPRLVEKARLLAEYDRAHRTDLLATLETYFACMGSVKRVSEKMHTHYNTVLYRLHRIGQITGCDLDDPAQWLELRMALLTYRYFQPATAGPAPAASGEAGWVCT